MHRLGHLENYLILSYKTLCTGSNPLLLFSKLNEVVLDALILNIIFSIVKINDFRDAVTSISAETEALVKPFQNCLIFYLENEFTRNWYCCSLLRRHRAWWSMRGRRCRQSALKLRKGVFIPSWTSFPSVRACTATRTRKASTWLTAYLPQTAFISTAWQLNPPRSDSATRARYHTVWPCLSAYI